jgi:hypothetical protein
MDHHMKLVCQVVSLERRPATEPRVGMTSEVKIVEPFHEQTLTLTDGVMRGRMMLDRIYVGPNLVDCLAGGCSYTSYSLPERDQYICVEHSFMNHWSGWWGAPI